MSQASDPITAPGTTNILKNKDKHINKTKTSINKKKPTYSDRKKFGGTKVACANIPFLFEFSLT